MIEDLKERQWEHTEQSFASRAKFDFESHHFHDHFRAMPFARMKGLLDRCSASLDGKRVLVASCGSGIDIHYLRKHYRSRFFASDLSANAIESVRRTFPEIEAGVEDTEKLSFSDDHFDYAFVAAGLHHLPRPLLGLYELLRVSRQGLIVVEPNDTWLTRFATRLGLATEIEEAGNYVYRFSRWDIEKVAKSLFLRVRCERFFATHRVARSSLEFVLLKAANACANLIAPAWGNYLVFYLEKSADVEAKARGA